MGHTLRQTNTPARPKGRPLSIDFSIFSPKNSIIFSLLPSAVQRKIHSAGYRDFEMQDDDRSMNEPLPPQYSSDIILRETLSTESTPETTEFTRYFEESKAAQAHPNPQFLESRSGIDWKFANQGINLLNLSADESRNPVYGNVPFARQLYLHGLTYLLRGLPSDLTPEEQISLQGSVPRILLNRIDLDTTGQLSIPAQAKPHGTNPPSILHKILASTIVQLFILFQFLLPYLKFFLQSAYEYERTHHISEKVLASGMGSVDAFGKQSLALIATLYGMGNGKVGQALTEAASWFIEGIAGGIHEGVGEGLNVIGAKGQPLKQDDPL